MVRSADKVVDHDFGETPLLVFVIISFGSGVYLAQGEEYDGVNNSYCDEKGLVDEMES